ncbi:hypothetical protein AUJ66_00275 [Candidatus Desantisbacteria bacterium CG1_02_38_46]|uniref:DNA-binding response regulator n=3 Tax=unclassified Candidatus Desantisiibacteriota TaxID=3106372 RepID=A0A2H9PD98_9BACT|nr:MAG: hypothetical protein AUJ66_00275 [Candidatus Desantisbacteria bacterium CG1_02_38_46]PIU50967.1 MAG: hypothetical protein COS91_06830 [Candidatus Desantisbacteria bacterium CG07_land_8_20_14_0_80_39_15]PIZ16593.1 MAG: hypothetical protein COY51_02450 [Candidatus Desantisbacteria bacterium CG_4_10_14_0_8_um_filter_39_17]
MKGSILIMDDDEGIRNSLSVMLEKEGYQVFVSENGKKGVEVVAKEGVDVAIADLNMPEMDGLESMREILKIKPDTIVIILTIQPTIKTAVQAMKKGAYDYIAKDANRFNFEEMSLIIERGLKERRIQDENIYLREELKKKSDFFNIVGNSSEIKGVLSSVKKMANTDSMVLIQGESGTGKELFAQAIHYSGKRAEFPFVTINCSALPETLLESELFGHEKGAYTGATETKKGLFEVADRGTIFLDEIGETPLSIQVKILRVLEEKEFRRVGGTRDIKVDVRVVVATNKDLQGLMKERKFREDLYYRLNVIPIYLCPLREKKEDIPLLIRYFIEKYNKILHKRIKGIEDEAVRLLSEYHWPGNVRELGNLIERVIALADEEKEIIAMTDLPSEIRKGDASILDNQELATARGDMDFKVLVNEFEKKIINETMAKVKKKKEAAKLLNLNPRILRYLIKKHGLENESPPC